MFVSQKAPPLAHGYKPRELVKSDVVDPPSRFRLTTDSIQVKTAVDGAVANNDNVNANLAISHSNNHKLHDLEAKMNRIENKLDELIALMKSK